MSQVVGVVRISFGRLVYSRGVNVRVTDRDSHSLIGLLLVIRMLRGHRQGWNDWNDWPD